LIYKKNEVNPGDPVKTRELGLGPD
jgi:hypothetical protein